MNTDLGFIRKDVEINAEGTLIKGWLYLPLRKKPSRIRLL